MSTFFGESQVDVMKYKNTFVVLKEVESKDSCRSVNINLIECCEFT